MVMDEIMGGRNAENGTLVAITPHNSISNKTEATKPARRAKVERMYLAGYCASDIAEALKLDLRTVQSDLDYIGQADARRVDTEKLRSHLTDTMLGVLDVAEQRYTGDGSTVEGRLMIDAAARLAKLQGLDESSTERQVGEAWASFLGRVAEAE